MSQTRGKGGESFADLFEKDPRAHAPKKKGPQIGERVQAEVVRIGRDVVFLELDGRRPAFVELPEMRGRDGNVTCKVGDVVDLIVISEDANNELRLGRVVSTGGDMNMLISAKEGAIPVEGKFTGTNKGGFDVDIGGVRAFCPMSQADVRPVQNPQSLIGQGGQFLITEIRENGRSVIVSRRALLDREASANRDRAFATLAVGSNVKGTVTSIRDFGAFVDIGGLEGLIPASEVSHDRRAVGDVLKAGDSVEVQIRDIREVTGRRGEATKQVTLSLKALRADPWDSATNLPALGAVISGSIVRTSDFGAFVRVADGIDGLLHNSELTGNSQANRTLKPGESILVVVKSVDKDSKRIGLAPAPEGAVAGSTVAAPTFGIGSIVKGTVDHVETFGIFIQLEGTSGRSGRGLIPNAELGVPRGADLRKLFPAGAAVEAKILETGEGRLRLSIRAVKDDEERAQYEGYRGRGEKFGTLADMLAATKKNQG